MLEVESPYSIIDANSGILWLSGFPFFFFKQRKCCVHEVGYTCYWSICKDCSVTWVLSHNDVNVGVCVCVSVECTGFKRSFWAPCSTKIEKEKKEHARQHGMIRTEISGAEIAEEMEKERRFFQLQMCEVCRCQNIQRFWAERESAYSFILWSVEWLNCVLNRAAGPA